MRRPDAVHAKGAILFHESLDDGGSLYLVWRLEGTRLGLYFLAAREDHDAAEALGVNTFRAQMKAMAISAGMTAIGGTVYAQYLLYIDPDSTFGSSIPLRLCSGLSSEGPAPFLARSSGLLCSPSVEITRLAFQSYSGVYLMIYGVILVAVIMFLPMGSSASREKSLGNFRKGGLKMENRPFLEVQSLSKSFRGLKAISDVAFRMTENEILGLIGPNGAGRRPVQSCHRLSPAGCGRMEFLGQNIVSLAPHIICKLGIARTFQIVKPSAISPPWRM